ncbi:site-specific integrase [Terribacillus saccharophilus]|uniref:site-specific integrase n=1 Tax=Terribacillus saccharophilus TaxID=361277 RepID=UPI0020D12347|nr:site-specific integrase [Terribacillus saccharophilus]
MNEYETKKGKYYKITVSAGINPSTGKQRQITRRGFKTKKEARAAITQIEYELGLGTYVHEASIKFADFAEEWFKSYKHTIKSSTARTRERKMNFLISVFGKAKIKDITKRNYQLFINQLHEQGYKRNSVVEMHITARLIFKKAVERKIIKENPSDNIIFPKEKLTVEDLESTEEKVKYMEKEELTVYLETALEKGLESDYEINTFQAYTGMRSGEIAALKWPDINFDEGTVRITKTLFGEGNHKNYELLTPKTKSSIRVIELDPFVLDMLQEYKRKQNIIKMKHRIEYHDEDFVFARLKEHKGYPRSVVSFGARMKRLLRLSGINKDLTPHSLRHTHTSLLAEAGVSLPEIQERLGHRDDKITTSVYLHTTKTVRNLSAEKFSNLMKSVRK